MKIEQQRANTSFPSSDLDFLHDSKTSTFAHFPCLDIYDDSSSDTLDGDIWMSVPSFDRQASGDYWMSTPTQSDYSPHPDYYSYGGNNRIWSQNYGDAYSPYSTAQTSPQSRIPIHRRALSGSTNSTSSPQQQPHQYPGIFDNGQYRHLQNSYYPTPTHTPTSGTFMDQGYGRGNAADASSGTRQNGQPKPYTPQLQTSGPQYDQRHSQQYLTPHTATPHTVSPRSANTDYADRRYVAQQPQQQQPYGETNGIYGSGSTYSYLQAAPPQQRPPPPLESTGTLPQAYADELYNPNMAPPQQQRSAQQPHHLAIPGTMQERLNAANFERHSRSPHPDIKREASPYRPESQFAREGQIQQNMSFNTARQQQQQQKWQEDAYQQWRHHTRGMDPMQQQNTISPKEAYVDDFRDPAEQSSDGAPLFPQRSDSSSQQQQQLYGGDAYRSSAYGPVNGQRHYPPSSNFSFQAPGIPASANVSNFAPINRQDSSASDTPAHLVSMETSKSEPESSQDTPVPPPSRSRPQTSQPSTPNTFSRPSGSISTADTGTYSCTYIGCPQRFPTPALLQKHKKDAHRPPAGASSRGPSVHPASMHGQQPGTSSPAQASNPAVPTESTSKSPSAEVKSPAPTQLTQAGPHRCDRVNPTTGKPCNTIFSRPYDLTRHEDTIHARRPKVHCQYCAQRGEEKTFSRADALTRHLRVVHPEVEVRGLGGRRRGL